MSKKIKKITNDITEEQRVLAHNIRFVRGDLDPLRFANMVGIEVKSSYTIYNWESCTSTPNAYFLRKIATWANKPMDAFFENRFAGIFLPKN